MGKIIYNTELLGIMNLFEKITHAKLKDAFIDRNSLMTFVVQENEIGKAIGKNAVNVIKLEKLLTRKIRIIEFNGDVIRFIQKLIYPLRVRSVEKQGSDVVITGNDKKTKGLLIGRNSQNLLNLELVVKKYFPIDKIKVA
ncbi:MAG: NusA-like transcription termination signal-binding factor [Nanoarchaeota archaeon]|nr:NusA-like transcription termination signal-binding factor [Nanoarchaeota archaeon]